MDKVESPVSYQEWLECFETLASHNVTFEYINNLAKGSCPGIEKLRGNFNQYIQETVNKMMIRVTRQCTKGLNELLEEGDFSYVEIHFHRYYNEMKKCRFYLKIPFLEKSFSKALDVQVQNEINRYWKEMKLYLTDLADETNSSDLYDILYYINRLK